ncbi:histidine kinase [Moniliophthora roreri]|nr:histidine kinase [Moniliophthora roreri]
MVIVVPRKMITLPEGRRAARIRYTKQNSGNLHARLVQDWTEGWIRFSVGRDFFRGQNLVRSGVWCYGREDEENILMLFTAAGSPIILVVTFAVKISYKLNSSNHLPGVRTWCEKDAVFEERRSHLLNSLCLVGLGVRKDG